MSLACTVCYEVFASSDSLSAAPCGHVLHHKCWTDWLHRSKNCPDCRHKTKSKQLMKLYFNAGDGNDYASLKNKYDALMIDLACKTKDCESAERCLRFERTKTSALREEINRLRAENEKLGNLKKRERLVGTHEVQTRRILLHASPNKAPREMPPTPSPTENSNEGRRSSVRKSLPRSSLKVASVISDQSSEPNTATTPKTRLAKRQNAGHSSSSKPSPAKRTNEEPQTSRSCLNEKPAKRTSYDTDSVAKRQKLSDSDAHAAKKKGEDSYESDVIVVKRPIMKRRHRLGHSSDEDVAFVTLPVRRGNHDIVSLRSSEDARNVSGEDDVTNDECYHHHTEDDGFRYTSSKHEDHSESDVDRREDDGSDKYDSLRCSEDDDSENHVRLRRCEDDDSDSLVSLRHSEHDDSNSLVSPRHCENDDSDTLVSLRRSEDDSDSHVSLRYSEDDSDSHISPRHCEDDDSNSLVSPNLFEEDDSDSLVSLRDSEDHDSP